MNHFWRYLLIAGLLFVGALAFIVVRNWDTVSLAWENAASMSEGSAEAREIEGPDGLVQYLHGHPEKVSLAVHTVDGQMVDSVAASMPRPLHRLPLVLLVTAAMDRMHDGRLDSTEAVPVEAVDRFALPGLTAGPHRQAVDSLTSVGVIQQGTMRLGDLVRSIHEFRDLAAADWLMTRMGADVVQTLPAAYGMLQSEAPRPYSATYVTWLRHRDAHANEEAPSKYLGRDRDAHVDETFEIARQLGQDKEIRRSIVERLETRGTDLSVPQQRAYAAATFPRGTAKDYATLINSIQEEMNRSISLPADVRSRLQHILETPIQPDSIGRSSRLRAVADVAGAYPGMLTFGGYVRTEESTSRTVVFTMHDLPVAVFYQLAQTGIDKGLFLQFLVDPVSASDFARTLGAPASVAARDRSVAPTDEPGSTRVRQDRSR